MEGKEIREFKQGRKGLLRECKQDKRRKWKERSEGNVRRFRDGNGRKGEKKM